MIAFYAEIRNKLKRNQTVELAIQAIAEKLQSAALKGLLRARILWSAGFYSDDIIITIMEKNFIIVVIVIMIFIYLWSFMYIHIFVSLGGSQTSLKRVSFIEACKSISILDELSTKQFSIMYSILDPMKT